METFLKIVLASSSVLAINFVSKTLTSNSFDRLLIPKYQKMLQTICAFIILVVLFVGYGALFGAFFSQIKDFKYTDAAVFLLFLAYVIGLMGIGCGCLLKLRKEKKTGMKLNYSEKRVEYIIVSLVFLNIIVYGYFLNEFYLLLGVKKEQYYGDIVTCILVFFSITYLLLKAQLYLQGYRKKRWRYVLSPTPEKIEEKHLYVLYAISATQLVLSEEDENIQDPISIYLFDMTKQTYMHFERVLTIKKEDVTKTIFLKG